MRSKIKNKVIALILSVVMVFSVSGTVYAANATLGETVYVLLDTKGSEREIIVKNNGGEQKGVKGELPFKVKIAYELNGSAINVQDIIGKNGDIKITVDITSNSKAKAYYKDNLSLQMQLPIDTANDGATDIVANGLTGVTVGAVKTLSGIVMPGKSAKYEVTYKTNSFKMQSINFVCMPFDIAGMAGDFDVTSIGKQIKTLQDGVTQYVDGVSQASSGLAKVNGGMKNISANGKQLLDGYNKGLDGGNSLIGAMLAVMTPEQRLAFSPQVQGLMQGQKQMTDSLTAYVNGVSQASDGLGQANDGMTALAKNGTTLKDGINSAVAPLMGMTNPTPTPTKAKAAPESFISTDKVSEIQFVMKTDVVAATVVKEDVIPTVKPKENFWDRLIALFGIK